MVPVLGVVAVTPDADRLAERGPDVVVVHARRHHAHDHLERARLGHLDLLELEGVARLALALLADDPGRHRLGQRPGLHADFGHVRQVNLRHVVSASPGVGRGRIVSLDLRAPGAGVFSAGHAQGRGSRGAGRGSAGRRAAALLRAAAAADPSSLYQGPGAAAGAGHPVRAARRRAPAAEHRDLEGPADPDLGRERLPRRRVPLPGLPLRRPRRELRRARPERPALERRHLERHVLGSERQVHLPDEPRLRHERGRPRRAAGQAAVRLDRLPAHAQHAQGPVAHGRDDRDRRHPRRQRGVPVRRQRRAARRSSSSPGTATPPRSLDARDKAPLPAAADGHRGHGAPPGRAARAARRLEPDRDPADLRRGGPVGQRRRQVPDPAGSRPTPRIPAAPGALPTPPAFFNVAFRWQLGNTATDPAVEPMPKPNDRTTARASRRGGATARRATRCARAT